ncbi:MULTISPECIES: ABC transporter ATP-binding protein [Vagococcus]|uniref:ABC transporter, ATP-binding protein n=1 Tax=Vagococcus fluvialis bH819 TaxID=1255619 RepID=A0A1X6WJI9_9ENTE|nr:MULTISPECIES: ABC transporter ATP-binding protein [Vagococcus]SLM84463.1 ABC transporter, ATP-binding protein [Vagococcus fluvialis bH819]HCM90502.1 ABC transporter ATP-binding protein [Vagococcus sp.]
MLLIDHLTIKKRIPILTGFSFTFEKGHLYGIVAVNGSGKTTFFRAIMGLTPIDSGSFSIQEVQDKSDFLINKHCFYFESNEWFDLNLSGLDYLTFIKKQWHSSKEISDIITLWQMEDYIRLPIKKYSLGMKQKLLISLYLVSDANYLLMDEITNGLDEESRKILYTTLSQLKQQGKTIILSSHYKEDIEEFCDYLLLLKNQTMEVSKL